MIQALLLCPRCGTVATICRKAAKQKKEGHYKNLYCYKCKSTHNHIEIKDLIYSQEEIDSLIEQMKLDGKYD